MYDVAEQFTIKSPAKTEVWQGYLNAVNVMQQHRTGL